MVWGFCLERLCFRECEDDFRVQGLSECTSGFGEHGFRVWDYDYRVHCRVEERKGISGLWGSGIVGLIGISGFRLRTHNVFGAWLKVLGSSVFDSWL